MKIFAVGRERNGRSDAFVGQMPERRDRPGKGARAPYGVIGRLRSFDTHLYEGGPKRSEAPGHRRVDQCPVCQDREAEMLSVGRKRFQQFRKIPTDKGFSA